MAISISLESNELLEHFQWKNPEEVVSYVASHREDIADEMADVFTYLIQFAGAIDVDLFDTTLRKLEKSAEKYPVEKSKGNHKKYTEL